MYNSLDANYKLWGKINMSWPNADTFGPRYEIKHPKNEKSVKIPERGWRWKEESFWEAAKYENGIYKNIIELHDGSFMCGRIWFDKDENTQPSSINYLDEVENFLLRSIISFKSDGGIEIEKIFEGKSFFSYPKPTSLIKIFIKSIKSSSNDLILDFFSGSATTAHAIMQLNAEDGGNRKFIMVQVPEPTDEKSEAFKSGYTNICEIGKERIRRAAKKIAEEQALKRIKQATKIEFEQKQEQHLDLGFRVYRLDSSNMHEVYYKPQQYSQASLDMFADNIKPDRSPQDLLTQIMLNLGLPLSLKIEENFILEKRVYRVLGNQLVVCFDKGIDEAFARAIAQDFPQKLVFRDASFVSDAAKVNVKQLIEAIESRNPNASNLSR